ncbi:MULTISPECIES: hypothetical protein [unclassified Micromonospora]|uniref:hypothetical protein n=1 Tax=unclassified Micromonospora TaxID=2617518 RepID=UPI002FF2A843
MSWSLLVTPLHIVAGDGGLEWAAEAASSFGLPEEPPPAREMPTVAAILAAFRMAGCHGVPWFRVAGHDVTGLLPQCPEPATCASVGGLDLGEVSLLGDDPNGADPLELDQTVTGIGFRKPSGRAVLVAVVALASTSGPLLVCDDSGESVFVVSPGDDPTSLAGQWPW